MSTPALIIGNEVVYSRIDLSMTPECIEHVAILPTNDWDGCTIYILDWKVIGNRVILTYQTKNDAYSSVLTSDLAARTDVIPYVKPRGKNWEWSTYGYWINNKTGKRKIGGI